MIFGPKRGNLEDCNSLQGGSWKVKGLLHLFLFHKQAKTFNFYFLNFCFLFLNVNWLTEGWFISTTAGVFLFFCFVLFCFPSIYLTALINFCLLDLYLLTCKNILIKWPENIFPVFFTASLLPPFFEPTTDEITETRTRLTPKEENRL